MDGAARNGHLDLFKWLHENRTEGCTTLAMDYAASHLDLVKWLHENRVCIRDFMEGAAQQGRHLDVVQWLLSFSLNDAYRRQLENTLDTEEGVKQRIFLFVMHVRTTRYLLRQWLTGPDHWTEEEFTQALEELIHERKITESNDGSKDSPFYIPVVYVYDRDG
jgi:hypothetical protein